MITVKEVRCTGDDGTNYGIISPAEALQTADSLGLDLVLIAQMVNLLLQNYGLW